MVGASLRWKRTGPGWRLFNGRRCFGELVPDSTYPDMRRSIMSGGRLSDMANITWDKHAVFEAVVRELESPRVINWVLRAPVAER